MTWTVISGYLEAHFNYIGTLGEGVFSEIYYDTECAPSTKEILGLTTLSGALPTIPSLILCKSLATLPTHTNPHLVFVETELDCPSFLAEIQRWIVGNTRALEVSVLMYQQLWEDNYLDPLLDIAYDYFKNPISIVDHGHKILCARQEAPLPFAQRNAIEDSQHYAQTFRANTEGVEPVCVSDVTPSHMPHKIFHTLGSQHELTTAEVKEMVQKFITTAKYCQMAQCDGVAIHAGHGYIFNSFLSPVTNHRTDEYGGSFENRVRFAQEVLQGIRSACGPNFIIGSRIPGDEFTPNGMSEEECIRVAKVFEAAGCDYLDVSLGTLEDATRMMETPRYPQGYRVQYAVEIKKAMTTAKVGTVGVLSDPEFCESLIREGKVDFVSIGRGLLSDPDWANKAKSGIPVRPCLSCKDGCYGCLVGGTSLHCAINPETGRESMVSRTLMATQPKKVLIIGGGIAGMQAAITASSRGHNVVLCEATDSLGGQMNLACVPPHKYRIGDAKDWFAGELDRLGITVHKNTTADLALAQSISPDEIILATGGIPVNAPISGIETTTQAWDVLKSSSIPESSDIVIIGGGIVGCEVAELLLTKQNRIILEMLPDIANGLESSNRGELMASFANGQVNVVGDAKRPRKFIDATREGFFAGNLV
ncbi:MAG: FAD-dependent oxidoreductase [Eubacteriales bacterium]